MLTTVCRVSPIFLSSSSDFQPFPPPPRPHLLWHSQHLAAPQPAKRQLDLIVRVILRQYASHLCCSAFGKCFLPFILHYLTARTVYTLCPNYHYSLDRAFVSQSAKLFLLSTALTSCSTIVSKNVGSPSHFVFLSADHLLYLSIYTDPRSYVVIPTDPVPGSPPPLDYPSFLV